MQTRKLKIALAVMCLTAFANFSKGQNPNFTFEMTSTGSSNAAVGPSTAPVVVTFRKDSLNAAFGTIFTPYSPAVTATMSFANQQFTTVYNNMSTGMAFGGGTTASNTGVIQQSAVNPIYNVFGASLVQPPQNGMFVSSPTGLIVSNFQAGGRGVGIDAEGTQGGMDFATGNFDLNFGTAIYTTVEPLWDANLSATGRYYYGDFIITFSQPITNPVVHFGGLGGSYNYQPISGGPRLVSYFSTELELQPVPGAGSPQFMAGNEFFNVSGNKILNSAPKPNGGSYDDGVVPSTGISNYGAATGSVRLNGVFTQLVYKVYVRGSVNSTHNFSQNQAAISGATRDPFNGDLFYVGVSFGCIGSCGLPITISDFNAVKNNCNALLNWKTSTEVNGDKFEIELSTNNGSSYTKVGTVAAVGNSQGANSYQYSYPMKPGAVHFFRLKMIDKDGSFKYSAIRSLSCSGGKIDVLITPNPVKDKFFISGMENGLNKVAVISSNGQLMSSLQIAQNQGYVDVRNFAPGLYMVKIVSEKGNTTNNKIIKN